MAEFVRFTLEDGSDVLFESAESDLVALHGGPPEVPMATAARLQEVAEAAKDVAGSLRCRLVPTEVPGVRAEGVRRRELLLLEGAGEGTIKVTLKWAGNSASASPPRTRQGPEQE